MLLSCGGLLPVAGPDVAAQEASGVNELDPIVVTATRTAQEISSIPGSVQVIERARIEEQLQLTSDPAVVLGKLVPGLQRGTEGVSSGSQTFRGRNVLVLVDGIPRTVPLRDVSRILSLIDLNNVDRIEVVAGASSQYGSGATGGTINFITKRGEGAEGERPTITSATNLRAFTHNIGESLSPEQSLGASGRLRGFDYNLTLSGQKTQQAYDGTGRLVPDDPTIGQGGGSNYDLGNASATLGYTTGAKRLELSGNWTYFDQDPQFLTDYDLDPARPDRDEKYPGRSILEDSKYLNAAYSDQDFALGTLSFRPYASDIKKRFGFADLSASNPIVYYSGDPSGPVSADGQTTLTSRQVGTYLTIDTPLDAAIDKVPGFSIFKGARFTWGGDLSYDETRQKFQDGDDAIAPMDQVSYAVFGQLEVPVTQWVLLRGGVRWQKFHLDVEDFTRPSYYAPAFAGLVPGGVVPPTAVEGGSFDYSEPTYNIGAVVFLTENTELFGGFSQGFELPDVGSFTRRAGLNTVQELRLRTVDYSDIGPEPQLVNNYELGVRGRWERFRAELTGYVSTSDEGVQFDPQSNTVIQQREKIYGVELSSETDVTRSLTLGTTVGVQEGKYWSKDEDQNYFLDNNRIATTFKSLLYADYRFTSGVTLHGEVEHFTGRDRTTDEDEEFDIRPGTLINASISYALDRGRLGRLSAGVDNLLDKNYDNPTATATRNTYVRGWGRTVSLGYAVTF